MSKIFKNNNLKKLFNDLSKSSLEVPNHLNVSNKKQSGGYNNDLNSMLASDSMNVLSTTTDELENNIKSMLGGKSKKQNRDTNEYSATSSDNIFLKSKRQLGGRGNDSMTSSAMVNMNQEYSATSSDNIFLKSKRQLGGRGNDSMTSSAMVNMNQEFSATSSDNIFLKSKRQLGGSANVDESATSSMIPQDMNAPLSATSSDGVFARHGESDTSSMMPPDMNEPLSATSDIFVKSTNQNDDSMTSSMVPPAMDETLSETSSDNIFVKQNDSITSETSVYHDVTTTDVRGKSLLSDVKRVVGEGVNTLRKGYDTVRSLSKKGLDKLRSISKKGLDRLRGITDHQTGGSKKKKAKKTKQVDSEVNPGFAAYLKFKKSIATLLNIPNGPLPSKIGKVALEDVSAKHPNLAKEDQYKKALEMIESDPEKYKKI